MFQNDYRVLKTSVMVTGKAATMNGTTSLHTVDRNGAFVGVRVPSWLANDMKAGEWYDSAIVGRKNSAGFFWGKMTELERVPVEW